MKQAREPTEAELVEHMLSDGDRTTHPDNVFFLCGYSVNLGVEGLYISVACDREEGHIGLHVAHEGRNGPVVKRWAYDEQTADRIRTGRARTVRR
jgi:hypothetical protein